MNGQQAGLFTVLTILYVIFTAYSKQTSSFAILIFMQINYINQWKLRDEFDVLLLPEPVTPLRHRTQALDSTAVKKIPT